MSSGYSTKYKETITLVYRIYVQFYLLKKKNIHNFLIKQLVFNDGTVQEGDMVGPEAWAQKEPVNISVYDGYTVLILLC